jgi:hypothetical protein
LSIVNTRVGIPAEYLPAYGAISFLPYSLRPIFAWVSSWLLHGSATTNAKTTNTNRHDKLLCPAFLVASLSFVGTVFVPRDGIILCFLWGFLRGIGGAWSDFLVGMSVIEFSRLQARTFSSSSVPSTTPNDDGSAAATSSYERVVSVNTAQSSTAKNVGSCVASIATFAFFARHKTLEESIANVLLLSTAAIFLLTALVSLEFQFHVSNLVASQDVQRYEALDDGEDDFGENPASNLSTTGMYYTSPSSFQPESSSDQSASEAGDGGDNDLSSIEDTEPNIARRRQVIEVSTLVAFQTLLAVAALQKPIIAISNQTTWVSLVTLFTCIVIFTICLGYRLEQESTMDPTTLSSRSSSDEEDRKFRSQSHILPHRQLNLYFLLRYSMPIAGFLMYSYLYSVFEKEPVFLQLLSVLKTAIGSLATFCYEKFLSPHCHSGWPLIGLIASLDIVMGLVALLDVWVIRMVKEKEVGGDYFVDTPLRCLVIAVGLAKYFFAELDYMPALVLSSTNVYSDDDQTPVPNADNDIGEPCEGRTSSMSDDLEISNVRSLSIDYLDNEEDDDTTREPRESSGPKLPVLSAGMQYASFLSCIDFGAQIGDWITVPIVASLGITRENHWDHLDKLVILCSTFRMTRVVFLWLICPPIRSQRKSNYNDRNDYINLSNGSE